MDSNTNMSPPSNNEHPVKLHRKDSTYHVIHS